MKKILRKLLFGHVWPVYGFMDAPLRYLNQMCRNHPSLLKCWNYYSK